MDYKMIAVDLDGTALRKDGRTLSERVERSFYRAYEKGIEIVLATGRLYGVLAPSLLTGASWQHLCVLCNGSEIRDLKNGRVLDHRYMKGSDLLALVEAADRIGIVAEVMTPDKIYLTQEGWERIKRYGPPDLNHHIKYALEERARPVNNLFEFCRNTEEDFVKAIYQLVDDKVRKAAEDVLESMPLSYFWSGEKSIEVTHPEASKAKGLRRVCTILGISMDQVVAIGDSGNDIPMLLDAGLGIAMSSASEEVKEAADVVTASNEEDGVALAIEKYVLHEYAES